MHLSLGRDNAPGLSAERERERGRKIGRSSLILRPRANSNRYSWTNIGFNVGGDSVSRRVLSPNECGNPLLVQRKEGRKGFLVTDFPKISALRRLLSPSLFPPLINDLCGRGDGRGNLSGSSDRIEYLSSRGSRMCTRS